MSDHSFVIEFPTARVALEAMRTSGIRRNRKVFPLNGHPCLWRLKVTCTTDHSCINFFVTGNSSIAAHLPPLWLKRGLVEAPSIIRLAPVGGPGAVLVGSVAPQSAAQLERFRASSPVCAIDIALAYAGHDLVSEARQFAASAIARGDDFAISTALPQDRIEGLQAAYGRLEVAKRAEQILSEIAKVIVKELGVRRLVVAGGETSGAVVRALGIGDLQDGPYREPGFSRAVATVPFPIALMLKSGKLGSSDLFAEALEDMRRPIAEEPILTRWPPKG